MANENNSSSFSEADRSIVDLLHRSSQLAEDFFARSVTIEGITARQFAVLAAVENAPNANQTEIVRKTGVDRSTMADIVRRLVKKQLLMRRRTPDDARAYAIRLAPRAEELMSQLRAKQAKAEEDLLAALSKEDRSRLIGLLQQVVDASGVQVGQSQDALAS